MVAAWCIGAVKPYEYLQTRKKLQTKVLVETLKAYPSEYIGKYFEIRGKVAGFAGNGETTSLSLMDEKNGTSWTISIDVVSEIPQGALVACLVVIGGESKTSLSDLKLHSWTYEPPLRALEESLKPKKNSVQQKKQTPTKKNVQTNYTAEQLVTSYKNAIKGFNRKLNDKQADTIARSILGFSNQYNVDPRLVVAVILAESHFRIEATSYVGAQGLGQLMPATAAGMGIDNSYDPVANIYGSTRYIKSMMERAAGKTQWKDMTWYDLSLALAAYNAGVGSVKKHGGVPPFRETQNYVRKVCSIYKQLCGGQ
jgi:hypothetical protein